MSVRRATLPSLRRKESEGPGSNPRAGGTEVGLAQQKLAEMGFSDGSANKEGYQDTTPLYVSAHRGKLPLFKDDFQSVQSEIQRATQGITDSPREIAQREARHEVETGEAEYVYPPLPAARAPIAVSLHQVGVPEPAVTSFPPHAQEPRTAPRTPSRPTSGAGEYQVPQPRKPAAAQRPPDILVVAPPSLWNAEGPVIENSRPPSLLHEHSASAQSRVSSATSTPPRLPIASVGQLATVGLMLWPGPKDELMVTDKKAGTSAAASALLPGDGQPSAPGAPAGCA